MLNRRQFIQYSSAAIALAGPLGRALAQSKQASDEFFIFIHAAGGWDVTLWSDPRNERRGIVEPASTANTDTGPIRLWQDAPLDSDVRSFQLIQPPGSRIVFGPGIGRLADFFDRLCLINGLAMNTVSHPDGTAYSATGRHLSGGRALAASVDAMIANELGLTQTFPAVSAQFPSSFAGELDRRAVPLTVERVGSIGRVLARAGAWEKPEERDSVTALLSEEADSLAARAEERGALDGFALQNGSLAKMLGGGLDEVFNENRLKTAWPQFDYKARFQGGRAVNAAFTVEAMKRNLVRCVGFALGGFDTHGNNYKTQAQVQQEAFDLIAELLKTLDTTAHPTRAGRRLSDHCHVLVMSDFCRTPQINLAGGRDHYPNNSALIISGRFKPNYTFGKSDPEQLLPLRAKRFSDGERPIAPPDLLATFLSAFAIPPRRYLRDGEVVPELLRS